MAILGPEPPAMSVARERISKSMSARQISPKDDEKNCGLDVF